jgi:site-specific recombinase XerD
MEHVKKFPPYVAEFIEYFRSKDRSETTLRNYLIDFEYFFTWMIEKGITKAKNIKDIPLSDLNKLRVKQITEGFINYISKDTFNPQTKKHGTKKSTVNRKISSLSSLFNYLANIAEDPETLEPYLSRNVMARIEHKPDKDDIKEKAKRIRSSILVGDEEIEAFRSFVAEGYGHTGLSKIAYKRYIQNRERDLAIISLILSSGLRIEEVERLNVDDVIMKDNALRVIRKGNKERTLYFSDIAKRDLEDYLAIRESRYNVPPEEKALFVTKQQTTYGVRMTKRAMQLMIQRYAKAFGKPNLSAHDLRHTFATRFHAKVNDIVKLKEVMDHESIQTTMIYTHVLDDELKKAIEKVDSYDE